MLIQRLMRHQSYQMTLRYAHLHPAQWQHQTELLCLPSKQEEKHDVLDVTTHPGTPMAHRVPQLVSERGKGE